MKIEQQENDLSLIFYNVAAICVYIYIDTYQTKRPLTSSPRAFSPTINSTCVEGIDSS